jgi:glycosyltransferase involved in cell wall biosynthesis
MPRDIDIVVPVLNEEASVDEFYARIDRLGYADSLIFVDNASTDRTVARLERMPGIRLIRHRVNEGYGSSILDAIASSDGDSIVVIDADLEYPPEAIPDVLAALREHNAVYASRFLRRVPNMPLLRRVGNKLVSATYNRLFRQHTTDFYTGLKGVRRGAFDLYRLRHKGFEHVTELGVLIALAGEKIYEVPVEYAPRSRGRSKMRHIPETLKFLAYVVGYWFRCVVLRRSLGAESGRPKERDSAKGAEGR